MDEIEYLNDSNLPVSMSKILVDNLRILYKRNSIDNC